MGCGRAVSVWSNEQQELAFTLHSLRWTEAFRFVQSRVSVVKGFLFYFWSLIQKVLPYICVLTFLVRNREHNRIC